MALAVESAPCENQALQLASFQGPEVLTLALSSNFQKHFFGKWLPSWMLKWLYVFFCRKQPNKLSPQHVFWRCFDPVLVNSQVVLVEPFICNAVWPLVCTYCKMPLDVNHAVGRPDDTKKNISQGAVLAKTMRESCERQGRRAHDPNGICSFLSILVRGETEWQHLQLLEWGPHLPSLFFENSLVIKMFSHDNPGLPGWRLWHALWQRDAVWGSVWLARAHEVAGGGGPSRLDSTLSRTSGCTVDTSNKKQ